MFLNISTFCLRMPAAIGVEAQITVVVTPVSSDLFPDEIGYYWHFRGVVEFYFCHDESFVLAQKLVHLERVVATLHQPAHLVDDVRFAEQQQLLTVSERNLVFELLT